MRCASDSVPIAQRCAIASSALRCAGVAIRCASTFPTAVPNCFCPGVVNIHELSPAAKIKLADDKNLLLAAATCCIIVKQQSQKRRRRRRRFWIHPVHQERRQKGDYLRLIQELRDDPAFFQRYFRLSMAQFDVILELLRPDIQLQNTRWRSSIDPGQQLAITPR